MGESGGEAMRASDADREAIAQRLRAAQDEGRLTITEYDDRLQKAYAATTLGELQPLVADLPEPVPAKPSPEVVKRDRRKSKAIKEWRDWAGVAFILIAIWAVTSISSGELKFFWPMIPIGIWGAINIASMISGDSGDKKHKGPGH
ncbi:DUF1707 SHOCT-like domain-containing protein [Saccharopolyspora shandongensis]|uniref:DUF1707 SHOCT-like domain-containing protein n=1 Tax=Saccharopolyspora shandongensis TaxID=418495 RepID=UPI0033F2FA86